jgi:hypothetical protein
MVMGPAGPGTNIDSAGEGQQQFFRNLKPVLSGTHASKLLMRTGEPVKSRTFAMFYIELQAKTEGPSTGKHTVDDKVLHIQGDS